MSARQQAAYVSVDEAATYLGVSTATIRRQIYAGGLPAYRLGTKALRIKRIDLDALMQPVQSAASVGGVHR